MHLDMSTTNDSLSVLADLDDRNLADDIFKHFQTFSSLFNCYQSKIALVDNGREAWLNMLKDYFIGRCFDVWANDVFNFPYLSEYIFIFFCRISFNIRIQY